jgi:AcrR family transcriptional regulator
VTTKRAWGAEIQNREEKFELKRRAVLHSAARILLKIGYDALSLADIAVDLHVAKPTIYYYFRNKDEIVRELMEMAVAAFLDPSDHPEDFPDKEELSGAKRFELFVRRCVRVTSNDVVGACLFAVYPNQLPAEIRHDIDVLGQPVVQCAERVIKDGLADGSIGRCDPALVYHFMLNGLRGVHVLHELGHGTFEEIADGIVAMLANGICPRA